MKAMVSKVPVWFLVAGLVLPSGRAVASGGVHTLTLEEVVHRSLTVFVVERAEPFRQVVRLRRQPKPHKGRQREPLQITYLSFTIKEVLSLSHGHQHIKRAEIEAAPPDLKPPRPATRAEVAERSEAGEGLPVSWPKEQCLPGGGTRKRIWLRPSEEKGLYRVELPDKPGETLWLVDSQEAQNNELSRMYVEKGVNKIPIYQRLEGGLRPEEVAAGQPYLLLVQDSPEHQSYEGVGGWGVLSIDKKDEVVRLLDQARVRDK